MDFLNSIGIIFIFAMAPIGVGTSVYLVRKGYQQHVKEMRLGQACIQESDDVLQEIQKPVLPRIQR